ncbi:hypothetical protein BZG36_02223 [Bifiguratus adelaidae]|uniref:MYND-type domain-containing protein n=1 Tax=Bifiguratus adelaidae TaxID=1938954 RepID=A0A261Y3H2_9FUNG|nr:hypothetical protein BZG36_02223 [Bifiguratus adelaidae]
MHSRNLENVLPIPTGANHDLIELRRDSVKGRGYYSRKTLNPYNGKLPNLVQCDPVVAVVKHEFLKSYCSGCFGSCETDGGIGGKEVENLSRCSGCRRAYYCGGACQKLDWRQGHKQECAAFKRLADKPVTRFPLLRALCRIIWTNPHVLRDLAGSNIDAPIDAKDAEDVYAYLQLLREMLTPQELTKAGLEVKTLLRLLTAWRWNTFSLSPPSDPDISAVLAIYIDASFFNHSCEPNAEISFGPNGVATIRLMEKVDAGDEINISYCPPLSTFKEREAHLKAQFNFSCQCNKCTDIRQGGLDVMDALRCSTQGCHGGYPSTAIQNNTLSGTCRTCGKTCDTQLSFGFSAVYAKAERLVNDTIEGNPLSRLDAKDSLKAGLLQLRTILHPQHKLIIKVYQRLQSICIAEQDWGGAYEYACHILYTFGGRISKAVSDHPLPNRLLSDYHPLVGLYAMKAADLHTMRQEKPDNPTGSYTGPDILYALAFLAVNVFQVSLGNHKLAKQAADTMDYVNYLVPNADYCKRARRISGADASLTTLTSTNGPAGNPSSTIPLPTTTGVTSTMPALTTSSSSDSSTTPTPTSTSTTDKTITSATSSSTTPSSTSLVTTISTSMSSITSSSSTRDTSTTTSTSAPSSDTSSITTDTSSTPTDTTSPSISSSSSASPSTKDTTTTITTTSVHVPSTTDIITVTSNPPVSTPGETTSAPNTATSNTPSPTPTSTATNASVQGTAPAITTNVPSGYWLSSMTITTNIDSTITTTDAYGQQLTYVTRIPTTYITPTLVADALSSSPNGASVPVIAGVTTAAAVVAAALLVAAVVVHRKRRPAPAQNPYQGFWEDDEEEAPSSGEGIGIEEEDESRWRWFH